MTLTSLLQELAEPTEPLHTSHLVDLAALSGDGLCVVRDRWPLLPVGRRRAVVHALSELAEDNVELNFDEVFFVALDDPEADVRSEAIQGLWEREDRRLLRKLGSMVQEDPDAGVRAEAARALGRFVLLAEFDRLPATDAGRVETLLREVVEDEDEQVEVRGAALEALGARSTEWVSDLISEAYEGGDRQIKLSAVRAMGGSCDEGWLDRVYDELGSEDAEMRFEAVRTCGQIGDEGSVSRLLPLVEDEDQEVREAAIGALGQLGGREAKEALRGLAGSAEPWVRDAALAALREADFSDDPMGFRLLE